MANLLTHHDPYHIHAIIGLLNLINIIVRIILLLWERDDIKDCGFGYNPNVDALTILIMCLPNISSFIFASTPTLKVKNDAFTIWKEYRLHAAIFGLRSCLLLAIKVYERHYVPDGIPGMQFIRIAAVMTSFFLAKTVTDSFPKQETTIRGMYKSNMAVTMAGFMQFVGSAGVMLGRIKADEINSEFVLATVIQLNAFNMTLRKKRIIGPMATQAFYSFLLSFLGFYAFVFRRFWAEPPTGLLDERLQMHYAAVIAYSCRRSGLDRFSSWITALIVVACLYKDSLLPDLMIQSNDSGTSKVPEF